MTDNVRYIRDYKRREEREAADVRLAKAVMGLDAHNAAVLERMMGVAPNVGGPDYGPGCPINRYADTAPCEMPPVQPSYTAPESDPA
jgi:hypothetical protein